MLTDFGISYIPESGSATTMKNSYSPFYASVEQLELKDAHPSYDIWSIGIIAYNLMAKNEIYMNQSDVKRIKNIKEENRDKLPECYS